MKVSLVVAGGQAAGLEIPIPAPRFLIGRRAQCHLRPASAEVSRQHCSIQQRAGLVFVHDVGSTNGTFVNGIRIDDEVPVFDGDTIQIGPLVLSFKIQPEEAGHKVAPRDAAATLLPVQDSAELLINELAEDESEQHAATESKSEVEALFNSGLHYWESQFKRK